MTRLEGIETFNCLVSASILGISEGMTRLEGIETDY